MRTMSLMRFLLCLLTIGMLMTGSGYYAQQPSSTEKFSDLSPVL